MMEQQSALGVLPSPERVVEGGTATWACLPGFPPAIIFPFTPAERYGMRSLYEFQVFMYRPLYWLGPDGGMGVDYDLSLAEEPEWEADGRTVTIRLKPWRWSNGEPVCADNVMFWVNMLTRKKVRFGGYVEGCFPDNLVSYRKVAHDRVSFTFDKAYSKSWILLNQLTLITPMPRAWDRTAEGPADASTDPEQVDAVYDFLMAENGDPVTEDNTHRVVWPDSPVWSVVNGPWRLESYAMDGVITFVPNEHYSGPNPPRLERFRQVTTESDEQLYELLRTKPDEVQMGFLPPSLAEQPDGDPTASGPNPLGERYTMRPQVIFMANFMALNFGNHTVSGSLIRQPYIRQALQSCMDQDRGVREIYRGYAWSQSGPIPMLPASNLLSPRLAGGRKAWPFDVDRARALLAENGWDVSVTPAVCVRPGTGKGEAGEGIPEGTRLSFSLRYWDGRDTIAQLMAQFRDDAAGAGIELRLSAVTGSVLIAEDAPGVSTPEHPRLWELSYWGGGWCYNHPTGENLFASGATCNFSNYQDERADELIARTLRSDDLDALYDYQEYIAEQVPVLFMPAYPRRLHEVNSSMRGVTPINPYGLINPENWYYVEDMA